MYSRQEVVSDSVSKDIDYHTNMAGELMLDLHHMLDQTHSPKVYLNSIFEKWSDLEDELKFLKAAMTIAFKELYD